jgi:selenocysteine-specific elongation factor
VVDVPGHERFVRTMVAGATGIDLALVCIACDDGVMPQTREHLAILDLLEVSNGVVALTKCDLVDDDGAALAREDAAEALAATRLAGAEVIEVSARTGTGLEELREALRRAASATRAVRTSGRTRLPVDRVFSLRGIGTVVTGTLWGCSIAAGDRVTLLPQHLEGRVRSLQTHDRDVPEAADGGRVAACLVGVERTDIARGSTVVAGPPPPTSYRLDVELHPVPGAAEVHAGDHVEVLHGTAATHARVVLLDDGALAQLRLEQPLSTLRGDHVVLRTLARPATVAGGVVADPRPARHAGGPGVIARLRALLDGSDADVLAAAVAERPARASDVVAGGLLDPVPAADAEAALTAAGSLVALGDGWLMTPAAYDAARAAAAAARRPSHRESRRRARRLRVPPRCCSTRWRPIHGWTTRWPPPASTPPPGGRSSRCWNRSSGWCGWATAWPCRRRPTTTPGASSSTAAGRAGASRWPSCATPPAPRAATRRRCWSAWTRTGRPAASTTTGCCAAAAQPNPDGA